MCQIILGLWGLIDTTANLQVLAKINLISVIVIIVINLDMRRCLKSLWSQKEWTKRRNWIFRATSGEHSQPA